MFVVTNRKINESKKNFDAFGATPNEKGPNELRVVEANKKGSRWTCDVIPDVLTTSKHLRPMGVKVSEAKKLAQAGTPIYASRYASHRILKSVNPDQGPGKNLVFFIHGYNQDIESAMEQALALEKLYNVEVLVFSWPALGGGGVRGTLSYLDDKRRAQVSAPAVNRTLEKFHGYLMYHRQAYREQVVAEAVAKCGGDRACEGEYIAKRIELGCPFKLTMLTYSMGNYVLKHALKTSTTAANLLIFDNIVLAAADVNNQDHPFWIDQLQVRKRVYITINEDDRPLRASRMKPGGQQLARLGAYVRNLVSRQGYYVDFTDADHVGGSHNYFTDEGPLRNATVQNFFMTALNG
ncbi:MAG: alpha/beta hydrolase, partial [Planctomycetota bacterium]